MSFTYRTITDEEFPAFAQADGLAFGHLLSEGDVEIERAALEFDRTVACFEDGTIVGTTASLGMQLTVPGGTVLPMGGLTWTAVIPTHRRRGALSGMMTRQLEISHARGEPLAGLLASEGAIYGRFGYGPATWSAGIRIQTIMSAFDEPLVGAGRCRVLDAPDAATVLPGLFEDHSRTRHGSVNRTPGLWHVRLADPEHHRDGAGRLYHVVHESERGEPDGYVSYRLKHSWGDDGISEGGLIVEELIALTRDAYAALWRYCLDMDLTETVTGDACATDEPLRWLLADPRQLRTTRVTDFLWLRLLDVETCLTARGYAGEGALVLEVREPAHAAAAGDGGRAGRYLLEVERGEARCAPTTRSTDLVLGIAELSAAYLGGTSFAAMAHAGRVQEATAGALATADRLFATARQPWCTTHF